MTAPVVTSAPAPFLVPTPGARLTGITEPGHVPQAVEHADLIATYKAQREIVERAGMLVHLARVRGSLTEEAFRRTSRWSPLKRVRARAAFAVAAETLVRRLQMQALAHVAFEETALRCYDLKIAPRALGLGAGNPDFDAGNPVGGLYI